MTTLSLLELVRVTTAADAGTAINHARDLGHHAEQWGYQRIWVAEHHNMPVLLVRQPHWWLHTSLAARNPFGSAQAVSCYPTMRPTLLRSNLVRLPNCIRRIDLGLGRAPHGPRRYSCYAPSGSCI